MNKNVIESFTKQEGGLILHLHFIKNNGFKKIEACHSFFVRFIIICCAASCIDWIIIPSTVYADNAPSEMNKIKVMTLNMHNGYDEKWRSNLAKALAFFETENPDIIILQEIESQKLKGFKAAGYKIVTGMNHNLFRYHFGNAILTRHKIIYHRHHYLPSSKEQRGLDEVAIDVNGVPVIVLGTHLGLGRVEQRNQLQEIERIIAYLQGPVILSGDFNVPPSDQLFVNLQKDYEEIGQAVPLAASFPTGNPKVRLDQIWLSRHWRLLKAQTLDWDLSDHRPVVAELAVDPPSVPVIKERIPEVIPLNNPLLPNVEGSLSTLSFSFPSSIESRQDKPGASVDLPLGSPLHVSAECDGSNYTAALNYKIVTFDFRDYISKWRNIRGKGKWLVSLARDNKDQNWISWEQYYRWNDNQGTKIMLSNRNDQINWGIEQTILTSQKFGFLMGFDTHQKILGGICFSPDRRNAFELRWHPGDSDPKWQFRWKYQK